MIEMLTMPWKKVAMYLQSGGSARSRPSAISGQRAAKHAHPLRLVRFAMMSNGTVGSLGTKNSYTKNAAMNTPPMISGARTCVEFHGKCTPPHVSPTRASVVPAMMMMFPLCPPS